jgi:hypothetical protein
MEGIPGEEPPHSARRFAFINDAIREFLLSPAGVASAGSQSTGSWPPGRPWQNRSEPSLPIEGSPIKGKNLLAKSHSAWYGVAGPAARQCGFLAARFFSRCRFSRVSSLTSAALGTVRILRNAVSRRSAGVPPCGMSAGCGNRIQPHHTAVSSVGAM